MSAVGKIAQHMLAQLERGRTGYYWAIGTLLLLVGIPTGVSAWYAWKFLEYQWWRLFG